MSETPNLNLTKPPGWNSRSPRSGDRFARTVLVLLLLAVVTLVVRTWNGPIAPTPAGGDAAVLKDLALALERRSLPVQAAEQWQEYLRAVPGDPEEVEILYRIGGLYLDARDYERAAANLVAAELIAEQSDRAPPNNLGRKLLDCLRAMGRYGEVGRELARQGSSVEPAEDSPVVARIAGEELRVADVDRIVERSVDQMIEQSGGAEPGLREQLLGRLDNPEARKQLLGEHLQLEVLSRRARELELDQAERHRDRLRAAELQLLASAVLEGELGSVRATDADLESYFAANREDYATPATEGVDGEPGEPAVEPSFEEVRSQVRQDYVGRKRRELTESLLQELMSRYEVELVDPAAEDS